MENSIDELLGNLDQTADEPDVLIDDRIAQAALAGQGYLITRLEDERRKASAQEFASKCKTAQDRINEIKAEREHVLTEHQAFTEQLALAGAELRAAQNVAHERSVEYNTIQFRLRLLEDRLHILRDEYNETSEQLRQLLASRNGGMNQ
jgi:chromosome segregation ATPase